MSSANPYTVVNIQCYPYEVQIYHRTAPLLMLLAPQRFRLDLTGTRDDENIQQEVPEAI